MEDWLSFFKTGAPLAGLAAIASILAFLLRHREGKAFREIKKLNLCKIIRVLWPDLVFVFALILGLVLMYRSLAGIQETQHEVHTISVLGGHTYSVMGRQGEISVDSDSIPFKITICGQFSVSQLREIEAHFENHDSCLDSSESIPIYTWVTERSKAGSGNLWWPHKGTLNPKWNGSYEVVCLLGGKNNYNIAEDGQLFGIRIYIPKDPCDSIKLADSYYLKITPEPLFISRELPIRTMRSDSWQILHGRHSGQ